MANEKKEKIDYMGLAACLADQDVDDNIIIHAEDNDENTYDEDTLQKNLGEMAKDPVSMDIFKLYSKEIRKLPLLTAEEEKKVAKKAEEGDKEARNTLVTRNLRLVLYHAYKFRGKGVDIMDLIQEGNMGLIFAADKFSYKRGYRFSTYATFWILQRMRKAIASRSGIIEVPQYIMAKIRAVLEARNQFVERENREPSIDELAAEVGYTRRVLKNILNVPSCKVSLDAPTSEDGEPYLSFCVDDEDLPLERLVERESLREIMEQEVMKLSPKEQYVIIHYFGLFNHPVYNGARIGREMGITRERVRQIKRDALIRMRLENPELEEFSE